MKIYLTRHGETKWNKEGRMQGRLDSDLTELGENQAKWLGESLFDVNIDIIISSSSSRTKATSNLIKGYRNIEIITKDELMEIDGGKWEGMLHKDISEDYPKDYHKFWNEPHKFKVENGGESFSELVNRAGNIIEDIISEYNGKDVLIVSHGMFLKAIYSYIKNIPLEEFWSGVFMKPTCLNILEVEGDNRKFILEGDISHYK